MGEINLVAAYLFDGKGGGKEVDPDAVKNWSQEQGVLWVHIDYKKSDAKSWLAKKFNLNNIIADGLFVAEARPRTIIHKQGILSFLRGINLNPGQPPEDMVSIRCYIEEHLIITSRSRHIYAIDAIREDINNGVGPATPQDFFINIATKLTDRIGETLEHTSEQFDDLEEKVLIEKDLRLKTKISTTRREMILFRRYIAPQREALGNAQNDTSSILTEQNRLEVREISDRLIRYIEDLDAIKDRATVLQEELMNTITEQMNNRMYVLSIIASIFLPITFVAGLLGANVGGIPGTEHPLAFVVVCIALVIIAVGQAIYMFRDKLFKKKKKK